MNGAEFEEATRQATQFIYEHLTELVGGPNVDPIADTGLFVTISAPDADGKFDSKIHRLPRAALLDYVDKIKGDVAKKVRKKVRAKTDENEIAVLFIAYDAIGNVEWVRTGSAHCPPQGLTGPGGEA